MKILLAISLIAILWVPPGTLMQPRAGDLLTLVAAMLAMSAIVLAAAAGRTTKQRKTKP